MSLVPVVEGGVFFLVQSRTLINTGEDLKAYLNDKDLLSTEAFFCSRYGGRQQMTEKLVVGAEQQQQQQQQHLDEHRLISNTTNATPGAP